MYCHMFIWCISTSVDSVIKVFLIIFSYFHLKESLCFWSFCLSMQNERYVEIWKKYVIIDPRWSAALRNFKHENIFIETNKWFSCRAWNESIHCFFSSFFHVFMNDFLLCRLLGTLFVLFLSSLFLWVIKRATDFLMNIDSMLPDVLCLLKFWCHIVFSIQTHQIEDFPEI